MADTPHNTPPRRPALQLVWGRARPPQAAAANDTLHQPSADAPPLSAAQLLLRCANNAQHAYAAGFQAGERRAYVRGWGLGVVHGVIAAACLAGLALAAWHTWGPTA